MLPPLALGLGLCAWKLACIRLGPDPDTDAYGHYVIARQLLETPLNLRIHWVWLPFYHAFLALGVAAGASVEHVRGLNAILSSLTPLLLLAVPVRAAGGVTSFDRLVLCLGALLAGAVPIAVQMGTSAQPEALFSGLLFGATVLLARGRHVPAALALSVAVLTRYEGWVALASIGGIMAWRALASRRWPKPGACAVMALPLALVLAWTLARWLGGEPWLGFLSENQRFAESAVTGDPAAKLLEVLASDASTWLLMAAVACALIGLPRTLHRHGPWFVAVPSSVLVFLAVGYFTRSHLGLERHLVAPSPFLALWLANGIGALSEAAGRVLSHLRARDLVFAGSSALCLVVAALHTTERLSQWERITRGALPGRVRAAQVVGKLPPDAVVVCDEASVEVLSGLPRRRFVRRFVTPAATPGILELARENDVYVVSWRSRMADLLRVGNVIHESAETSVDALVAVHLARAK